MNEVTVINTSEVLGQTVCVYGSPEEPLFLAKDVAEWIEHSNVTEMLRTIDEAEKLTSTILRAGQLREVNLLTEDGLYEVLMQSRKPKAKIFKTEVKKMLKSIRKYGGYIAGQEKVSEPELVLRAMQVLQRQVEDRNKTIVLQDREIADHKKKIAAMEPKARFADAIGSADNCISVGEMAKILCQNGYQTGQRRLFDRLRNEGYIMRNPQGRYIPMQMSMNLGIMRIEESLWVFNNEAITIPTIRITPKGQQYFINRYARYQFSLPELSTNYSDQTL